MLWRAEGDRGHRRPALLIVALGALVLAAVALAGLALWPPSREAQSSSAPARLHRPPPTASFSPVPVPEIEAVHGALHGLGTACAEAPTPAGDAHARIDRHVAVLLEFARRYPQARFPIDDESGTSLSLLLVVRQELEDCDPVHLPEVERLLPPRFRAPTAPPT